MDAEKLAQLLEQAQNNETNRQYEDAATLYEEIIANTGPNSPDEKIRKIRLKALGRVSELYTYLVSEKYDEGLAHAEQYQAEAMEYKDKRDALFNIGEYAFHFGDNKRSLATYRAVLDLIETEKDETALPRAYNSLATAYIAVGRLEDATNDYLKAIDKYTQLGDKGEHGKANTWNRLGLVYLEQGEISKAINAHEKFLKYYQETFKEDVQSLMTAFNNLGEGYLMAYDLPTALHFFQQGLAYGKEGTYLHVTADLQRNIGVVYSLQGDSKNALKNLNHALKLSEASANVHIQVQVLYSLALAEFEAGKNESAFAHAQSLLNIAGTGSASTHYANAIHLVGIYYQQKGQPQVAEKYWQEAIYIAHEAKQRRLLWQLHAKMAEIASTPDLAQVHLKIAADILERMVEGIDDPILQNTFRRAKPVQAVLSQVEREG